ncbi:MAG: CheB methylesterase [Burkholderiales bacterium]|jgi:two-component system chemotaxis response regulator CheB|nr:CheB methylesterase [Burkholderiales bacterium]
MASFEIVALAASAGGLNALSTVLTALPAGFPAPLVVVQHLDRRHPSLMAEILGRRTALRVKEAAHGERVCRRQRRAEARQPAGARHLSLSQ